MYLKLHIGRHTQKSFAKMNNEIWTKVISKWYIYVGLFVCLSVFSNFAIVIIDFLCNWNVENLNNFLFLNSYVNYLRPISLFLDDNINWKNNKYRWIDGWMDE